jgi:large subunit ribosomal protein L24
MLAAHLSKELREKYKRRSLPVRVGDEVEIMRGEFKGKHGKIVRVNLKKYKVYVEGVTRKTSTGTEKLVPIHPSNLRIINLNLSDKWRVKILERKGVKVG